MLGDIYTNLGMIQPALLKYQSALNFDAKITLVSLPRAIEAWIRLEFWEPTEKIINQARLSSAWEEIPASSRSTWARIEAMVAVHLGKDERAEQALVEALEMDPLDGRVALELARFYTRHEKWVEASNYYERAQKEKSLEFQALIEEARMWTVAGDWSRGLEEYRKAESMQPSPKLQKTITELSRSIELRKL
jgi:tetratricopeptide (TPR) repeat protein